MTPKSRYVETDRDDLVWERLDKTTEEWCASLGSRDVYRAVGDFILQHKKGQPEMMHLAMKGGYNIAFRMAYKDGSSAVLRVPIKGLVPFPEEKIRYEVATMRYISTHTTIPVPHIYHHGSAAENPTGLGPFIIMDYIDHRQNMSRELLDPTRPHDERPMLDPGIAEDKLMYLYSQMASILLQLDSLKFSKIGSLMEIPSVEGNESTTSIAGRPLTANMVDLVVHTSAPPSILPSSTYDSTHDWLSSMADMHTAQLALQHNDAVEDEGDARDKYVARQLFRNLACERRLSGQDDLKTGFRLFSEDFRPANVLLGENLQVVGVIDWEFAYAAPSQFSSDAPWWLLLREPENWPDGFRSWMEIYERRLKTFLRAMESEERKLAATDLVNGVSNLSLADGTKRLAPLSQRMRESWENKSWMLNYAARKSWAFDWFWWKYLDQKYYGPNDDEDHQIRLDLLTEPQMNLMDRFVARKMRESEDQKVVKFCDEEAASLVKEVLI
ncbi:phosphotransferase family protein [Stachybotrys elegans]|uniref:Phosphotransferase family protein n=1 Tax=Stachybotrys elegans TaxID=80388 RepID=A0A8K0WR60_9HYPO|nr:phosphotransferase family protein [Stachybotrys elegans]